MNAFGKMALNYISSALVILLVITVQLSHAWLWPISQDEITKVVDSDNVDDVDDTIQKEVNSGLIGENLEEEEEVENERNLRCAQDFNRNLYKVLKSVLPSNATERVGRQDDTDTSPDELVESMLNLDVPGILFPVLRIIGSAAANNATGIDENYKTLPLAVRYQVTDFIKFTIDLISTTS